jgi:phosphatidylglycerophosphate synthase
VPDTPRRIAIDARPRSPHGPWAAQQLAGRGILSHHLDLAQHCGAREALVVTSESDAHRLRRLLDQDSPPRPVIHWTTTLPTDSILLSTDRLYDPRRLRGILRRQADPERAVIWRLDQAGDLEAASAEWTRRLFYQPIGHVWAWPLARWLARALQDTPIRPNHLTLAACGFMLAAAACVVLGTSSTPMHIAAALALALGLVLDTADGHLARLQNTASASGRWLDALLDELSDMTLHASIGWAMTARASNAGWLLAAFAYAAGKYLFTVARVESDIAHGIESRAPSASVLASSRSPLRRIVHALGHADIRWHLWIVLALLGRLEIALVVYTLYYPARVLAIAWKRMAPQ